jgi:hypothetical protein
MSARPIALPSPGEPNRRRRGVAVHVAGRRHRRAAERIVAQPRKLHVPDRLIPVADPWKIRTIRRG